MAATVVESARVARVAIAVDVHAAVDAAAETVRAASESFCD